MQDKKKQEDYEYSLWAHLMVGLALIVLVIDATTFGVLHWSLYFIGILLGVAAIFATRVVQLIGQVLRACVHLLFGLYHEVHKFFQRRAEK